MTEPKISIIVAIDDKRGIGKNNDLLFKIPADFERMRGLTRGHPLIMGRRTFESIGRVLPERTSIVVTHDPAKVSSVSFFTPEVQIVSSLEEGIERAKQSPGGAEIFTFGGGEIFREALEGGLVDRLYLTIAEGDYGADTFFPDYSEFKRVIREELSESGGVKFRFVDLEKKR